MIIFLYGGTLGKGLLSFFFNGVKKNRTRFFVTSDLYFASSIVSIEHLEFVKHIYRFFLRPLLLILYLTTVSQIIYFGAVNWEQ